MQPACLRALRWGWCWVLALAGCGGEPPPPAAPPAPPAPLAPATPPAVPTLPQRATYEVVPVGEDWGAIEGMVFLGRTIEPSRVRPTRCEDVTWTEHESDLLRYDRERLTLAQAFVFLTRIERGKDWPEAMRAETRTLTLTLRDGFFEPNVAWVRRRTGLAFVNGSQTMENQWKVFALGLAGLRRDRLVCNLMVARASRVEASDATILSQAGPHLVMPDL